MDKIKSKNGNGIFLKIIVGVLSVGLVTASGAMIKLYRDVGILEKGIDRDKSLETLEKRVSDNEKLLHNIGTDRDKRTVLVEQFKANDVRHDADINEIKRKLK